MTTAALRKKIHGYIDTMPVKNLTVIKPLYTIKPATPEETKKAEKRIQEYYKDPSSFVPFKKRVTG
jgi:hypothetical protein